MSTAGWLRDRLPPPWRGPARQPATGRRKSFRRWLFQYSFDLSLSYVLAVVEAAAILIPLRGHTSVGANADFARQNTVPVVLLIVLSIIGVASAGAASLAPTVRWYVAGDEPTPQQREAVMKLAARQSAILESGGPEVLP